MSNHIHTQPVRWAVGFDGSAIPQLHIDQQRWSQHDVHWREDLGRIADELGCRWVHYPLAWHEIEKAPGVFDWSWSDERFELASALDLNLIVAMTQCGTPRWLPNALGDTEFPAAFERFARALARRYGEALRHVCPFNRSMTAARLSGRHGTLPPYGRSEEEFAAVALRVADATQRAIAKLREEQSTVEIWASEDVALSEPNPRIEQDLLGLDLVLGRVGNEHPLRHWLAKHGASRFDLDGLVRRAASVDILNLNVALDAHNTPAIDGVARAAWDRCGIPLSITLSGNRDANDAVGALRSAVEATHALRRSGIPVQSFSWSPVLDHVDWDGPLPCNAGQVHPNGLIRLQRDERGSLLRYSTELGAAYAALIQSHQEVPQLVPVAQDIENHGRSADAPAKKEHMTTSTPPRDGLASSRPGFSLIVHSHLRWDWVWQRPQQFLSRLSGRHPVLFCEGPRLVDEDITPYYTVQEDENYPNVSILLTYLPSSRFHDGAWVDAQRMRLLKEALAGPLKGKYDRPVQWFYDPMAVPAFIGKMGELANVYDCMDQLSQFRFAPPALIERERMLLGRADVVFAGGYKMWEDKKKHNDNAHFYGCGVDVDHFATARSPETEIPADIAHINGPILGYFGVVDERLDYELIAKLANSNPAWNVVIVGPACKIDPNELPKADNLHWLGGRDYSQLPAYAKAFDVCLMPFALNEATEFINPTKTLEYMAMAKPIVSTAVPDVVTNFGRNVAVAQSADDFVQMCRRAVTNPDCDAVKRGIDMANRNTWDYIVSQLERHIEEALTAKTEAARTASHIKAATHKPTHRHGLLERRSVPRSSSLAG